MLVIDEAQKRCSGDATCRDFLPKTGSMVSIMTYRERASIPGHVQMRKTSYTDSTGKPIYEGDIVDDPTATCKERVRFYVAMYHDVPFFWAIYSTYDDEMCGAPHDARAMTIIGNVFENPELLTEGIGDA